MGSLKETPKMDPTAEEKIRIRRGSVQAISKMPDPEIKPRHKSLDHLANEDKLRIRRQSVDHVRKLSKADVGLEDPMVSEWQPYIHGQLLAGTEHTNLQATSQSDLMSNDALTHAHALTQSNSVGHHDNDSKKDVFILEEDNIYYSPPIPDKRYDSTSGSSSKDSGMSRFYVALLSITITVIVIVLILTFVWIDVRDDPPYKDARLQ